MEREGSGLLSRFCTCVLWGLPSPRPCAGQPWGSCPAEAADAGVGHCLSGNFEALLVHYLTASCGAAPPSRGGKSLPPLCSAAASRVPRRAKSPVVPLAVLGVVVCLQRDELPWQHPLFTAAFPLAASCGCSRQGQGSARWAPGLPRTICRGSGTFGADPGPCASGIVYHWSH